MELTRKRENTDEMKEPLMQLKEIARRLPCAVVVAHHETKPGEERRKAIHRVRGSSTIAASTRAAIHFTMADGGDLTVTNVKQSRAPLCPAFAVGMEIETDPENRALWSSARLYKSGVDPMTVEAEGVIVAVLQESPGLSSNEI